MPSPLEYLLGLLPATSGGYIKNEGLRLLQKPEFRPASDDLSWAFRMSPEAQKRAGTAVENMPESDNVDDRRVSDKTLTGYHKLIDSLDRAGYTQYRKTRSFGKRPSAQEAALMRAAGEKPMQASDDVQPPEQWQENRKFNEFIGSLPVNQASLDTILARAPEGKVEDRRGEAPYALPEVLARMLGNELYGRLTRTHWFRNSQPPTSPQTGLSRDAGFYDIGLPPRQAP